MQDLAPKNVLSPTIRCQLTKAWGKVYDLQIEGILNFLSSVKSRVEFAIGDLKRPSPRTNQLLVKKSSGNL
jgi:hypothetical protein